MVSVPCVQAFYGSRKPQWLVESRKEPQSHFDCRGCVRQIRRSNVHTPPGREYERTTSTDRQAYVYTGAPATVHTVVDHRPAAPFTTMNTTVNIPVSTSINCSNISSVHMKVIFHMLTATITLSADC